MQRTAYLLTALTVCVSVSAKAAPVFQETFENPLTTANYLTASGTWHLVGGQAAPPPPTVGPKPKGWLPVYGENVSIKRHRAHLENIPGATIIDGATGVLSDIGADLGGDYWNSAYPIGVVDEFYFGTGDVRPSKHNAWNFNPLNGAGTPDSSLDALTVDLVSKDIDLTSNPTDESNRYVAFLIGGDPGAANPPTVFVSVEMTRYCQLMNTEVVTDVNVYDGFRGGYTNIYDRLSSTPGDRINTSALVTPVAGISNRGDERMSLVIIDLWRRSHKLGGNPRAGWCATGNRIRMRDLSTSGHLNVDQIMVGSAADIHARFKEAPFGGRATSALGPTQGSDRPAAVYGYADIHTHWMSHMGSGAEPLPALTSPAMRHSLAALQTRMGAMAGLPWQPEIIGGFELCPSDWVNADATLVCDAKTKAATCNLGLCTLDDKQRDCLALAGCDKTKHQDRSTEIGDGLFNDANYNSLSSTRPLLHGLAKYDGSSHMPHVAGEEVGNKASHGQYGYNWDRERFVVPERPFLSKIHQQMYWKWLKRAWQGGLRIMVSDVQHSLSLDLLMHTFWDIENPEHDEISDVGLTAWTHVGHVSDEQYAAQRQVCAMKNLAAAPELASFARIVFAPHEARRAIADGKLAIVLGAELDSLGRLRAGGGNIAMEIDFLRGLGIRKITPIHQFDNELGGAAIFEPLLTIQNDAFGIDARFMASANCATADNFNLVTDPAYPNGTWNRWLYGLPPYAGGSAKDADAYAVRPADVFGHLATGQIACTLSNLNMKPDGKQCGSDDNCAGPTHYFQVQANTPAITFNIYDSLSKAEYIGSAAIGSGDTTKRVAWEEYSPLVLNNHGFVPFFVDGLIPTDPLQNYASPQIKTLSGHVNNNGLTAWGRTYVLFLMSRGLLIDVEHMSMKSREATLPLLYASSCTNKDSPDCQARAYPIIATHSDLRWATAWTSNERQFSENEVKRMMQVGGVFGLTTGYGRHATPMTPRQSSITDMSTLTTCPGSPSDFALMYLAYISAAEQAGTNTAYFTQLAGSHFAHVTPRPPHWAATGVSIGSDFNGFASEMGPRHFRTSCYGNEDLAFDDDLDPTWSGHMQTERGRRNGVYYDNDIGLPEGDYIAGFSKSPPIAGTPPQPPMKRLYFDKSAANADESDVVIEDDFPSSLYNYPPPYRGFDFNYVGHANIGLTPDMLQNMVNAIRTTPVSFMDMRYQMRYLFRGAEDFIETWEKSIATCARSGSTNCTGNGPMPGPPAGGCDMWPSDVDAAPTITDDTPSCMFRCGQKLTFNNGESCRCYLSQAEIDNHETHPDDLCDDFKPWCHWYYNGADDPDGNVGISVP